MPEVTTLGILVADVLARPVDAWPAWGKLMRVDEMTLHIGGCAANTGIDLAKLGIDTAVIGKVGNDGFGDYVENFLQQSGVDASGVRRTSEANTSASMCIIQSSGERTFIHHVGANATIAPEDVNMGLVGGSKILHVAGSFLMPGFDGEPTATVLEAAKAEGVLTSLDTAWDATGQWMRLIEPVLPHLDFFIPSFEEAKEITELQEPADVAAALRDQGVGTVSLKMGTEGGYTVSDEGTVSAPIFRVDPIDATGAGDAYAAGFLCGVCKGWDLERTTRLANAVGALCVSAIGTTTGVRDWDGTMAFMEGR